MEITLRRNNVTISAQVNDDADIGELDRRLASVQEWLDENAASKKEPVNKGQPKTEQELYKQVCDSAHDAFLKMGQKRAEREKERYAKLGITV